MNTNDNEIIKAFECCVKGRCNRARCPRFDSDVISRNLCRQKIMLEVFDLINRQRAEIERLEREIEDLESTQEITPEAKHFIDTKADKVISLMNELIKSQEQIKAEAIKEFAERVKEKSSKLEMVCSGAVVKRDYTIDEKTLNNLVKEMIGEG